MKSNLTRLKEKNAADYGKVYSGRHGCMCGCLGNYTTNPSSVKRMYTKMINLLTNGENIDFEINDEHGYIFVSTPTRYLALYKGN